MKNFQTHASNVSKASIGDFLNISRNGSSIYAGQPTEEELHLTQARQQLLKLSDGQLHQFKPMKFNTHQQSLNEISKEENSPDVVNIKEVASKTKATEMFNPNSLDLNTINETEQYQRPQTSNTQMFKNKNKRAAMSQSQE